MAASVNGNDAMIPSIVPTALRTTSEGVACTAIDVMSARYSRR